jgi:hypothetical protein
MLDECSVGEMVYAEALGKAVQKVCEMVFSVVVRLGSEKVF